MGFDFEKTLKSIGEFGIFQKGILFLLAMYPLLHGMQSSVTNFISPWHNHWCYIDELQNLTYEEQRNIAIPDNGQSTEDAEYDECLAFDLPWGNYSSTDFASWNRSVMADGVAYTTCDKWVFDTEDTFKATAASEVNTYFYHCKSCNTVYNMKTD